MKNIDLSLEIKKKKRKRKKWMYRHKGNRAWRRGGGIWRGEKKQVKERETEKGRDEEKERWPLQVQQHTGTELWVPRQDSMSCLFVSIDQPIKGLWWEAYWFWRPKGQRETKIKEDGGVLNSFQPRQPHICRMKKPVVLLSNVYAVHFARPNGKVVDVICLTASLEAPLYVLS